MVGGWLADRFGGKRVLAGGVLLWSAPPQTSRLLLLLFSRHGRACACEGQVRERERAKGARARVSGAA